MVRLRELLLKIECLLLLREEVEVERDSELNLDEVVEEDLKRLKNEKKLRNA